MPPTFRPTKPKWRRKRWVICNGYKLTMKLFIFVTGQIDMKFWQKTSVGVLCWTLMEEFWKFSLKVVILPQNRHFWVVLTGLRVTDLCQGLRLSTYLSLPSIGQQCAHPNQLFVRLTALAAEAPKVTRYPNFDKWTLAIVVRWHSYRLRRVFWLDFMHSIL